MIHILPRGAGFQTSTSKVVLIVTLILASAVLGASPIRSQETAALRYNKDIRPILQKSCFSCHGPDETSREADLRLDQRDSALASDVIVPGNAHASELARRILSADPTEVMPPGDAHKALNEIEKRKLVRWLDEGASYEQHWAWSPPTRPEPPKISDSRWARNEIDHFVARHLQDIGLEPRRAANRRTLARRVSLDLTGLPPDVELLGRFLNDDSEQAYENLVDELLKSPQWGEHRARYWLDYARYADTHGLHFDNFREIWAYRDWVIQSFSNNMPYDAFTIANLAGDLKDNPSLNDLIASGFNRCNVTTDEAGIIDEEYRVLYARDRTETTALVWLGLTAGCAACHDHKYDPLTQEEFYGLTAFFNNLSHEIRDNNQKATPPTIVVPPKEQMGAWDAITQQISAIDASIAMRRESGLQEFEDWWSAYDEASSQSRIIPQPGGLLPGFNFELEFSAPLNDGIQNVVFFTHDQSHTVPLEQPLQWIRGAISNQAIELSHNHFLKSPVRCNVTPHGRFSCAVWLRIGDAFRKGRIIANTRPTDPVHGWDLALDNGHLVARVCEAWPTQALRVLTKIPVPRGEWIHVAVVYDGSKRADGLKLFLNGKMTSVFVHADNLETYADTPDLEFKIGPSDTSETGATFALEDLRVYSRRLLNEEIAALAKMSNASEASRSYPTSDHKSKAAYEWWLWSIDDVFGDLLQQKILLVAQQSEIASQGTVAYVSVERDTPATAHVLERGEYDRPKEEVSPQTPVFLPQFDIELPRNRLGLAKWLVSAQHPLTARVAVNRFWQEIFGSGLVSTADDFGVTGEYPSHPDLLDWLSVEFRDSGWDVKRLFKLIVMSSTYRQDAAITEDSLRTDPDNRALSRGPRFRMDAEMIRDYALSASGLLVERIGGPSVKPYQPRGVWESVAMIGSNTRDYRREQGDALYRRSLYTLWKRSAPPASMATFDAPSREVCTIVRQRTNTPLQALATMNDEQYIEAARHLAETALTQTSDELQRLQHMAVRVLARSLSADEISVIRTTHERLIAKYSAAPDDANALINVGATSVIENVDVVELASWTMIANLLLNLDETVTK